MKKKSKHRYLYSFFIKIAVIVAIVFFVYTYLISFYRMDGNNMFPSVRDGDLCFILKTEKPRKDDIVLWKGDDKVLHLSRIVAVEDQTVVINDDGLIVDDYAVAEYIYYETKPSAEVKYPLTISKDSYFALNDYREDVTDSRMYGEIKRENIIGKVFFLFRRRGF